MYRFAKINCLKIFSASVLCAMMFCVGCSPIEGERYWYDDQTKEELANDYMLPESPPEYPVPTDPPPFIPKALPSEEVELATKQEKEQIALGIPRSGVPDPLENRVVVPAEKYVDASDFADEYDGEYEEDYLEEGLDEDNYVEDEFVDDSSEDAAIEDFALEEEKVGTSSSEARDFMDEMDATENYTTKGEQNPGGSGNTQLDRFVEEGYTDNPDAASEEATDSQLNDFNIIDEDPFPLPE